MNSRQEADGRDGATARSAGPAIRVVIVDDHVVFAEALQVVLNLESDIEVVAVSYGGHDVVERVLDVHPNVVLMDYDLPGVDGVAATSRIRRQSPETRVVMLTASNDPRVLAAAVEAGASGYLTKERAAREVAQAVRAAAVGEMLIPPGMLPALLALLKRRADRSEQAATTGERLTRREREILEMLASGMSTAAIADAFVISPHTVRTHLQNIMAKLEVHSKLEAVTQALRLGLISVRPA